MPTSAPNATQVRIGITGGLFKAPLGSTAPTDASTVLDAAYVDLGYLNEDGLEENWEDSVDDVIAWQGATTVRSATTQATLTLSATCIETKGSVLEMFHRGSTIAALGGGEYGIDIKPVVADPAQWVLHVIDGTNLIRVSFLNAEVVARGSVMYANGQPIGYPIELRAYPDANGNIAQKFSNDPAWGYS